MSDTIWSANFHLILVLHLPCFIVMTSAIHLVDSHKDFFPEFFFAVYSLCISLSSVSSPLYSLPLFSLSNSLSLPLFSHLTLLSLCISPITPFSLILFSPSLLSLILLSPLLTLYLPLPPLTVSRSLLPLLTPLHSLSPSFVSPYTLSLTSL